MTTIVGDVSPPAAPPPIKYNLSDKEIQKLENLLRKYMGCWTHCLGVMNITKIS